MKNKTLLSINRIIAFLCFLCTFGKLCFELGSNINHDGFGILFVFPFFYLGILLISHKLVENICYTRKTYVIIASIITAFIAIMWLIYLLIYFSGNTEVIFTRSDIWHDCIITVGSIIMAFVYYLIAIRFENKK